MDLKIGRIALSISIKSGSTDKNIRRLACTIRDYRLGLRNHPSRLILLNNLDYRGIDLQDQRVLLAALESTWNGTTNFKVDRAAEILQISEADVMFFLSVLEQYCLRHRGR